MPTDVVVFGIDAISDPAFDIDANDKRRQKVFARDRTMLAQSQNRREDRPRRVDHATCVGVVVIQDVRSDAVDQGGIENIESFRSPEETGLRRT